VLKALCYRLEGCRSETWWDELFLSVYLILLATLGSEVFKTSNRNEWQKQKKNVSGE
jgi:hypothetical protein